MLLLLQNLFISWLIWRILFHWFDLDCLKVLKWVFSDNIEYMDVALCIQYEKHFSADLHFFYSVISHLQRIFYNLINQFCLFESFTFILCNRSLKISDASIEITNPKLFSLRKQHRINGWTIILKPRISGYKILTLIYNL